MTLQISRQSPTATPIQIQMRTEPNRLETAVAWAPQSGQASAPKGWIPRLQKPATSLGRALKAAQPFIPMVVGVATLATLTGAAAAAAGNYTQYLPKYYNLLQPASNPLKLFFTAENGAIAGTINAPYDGIDRYCIKACYDSLEDTAQQLAAGFLSALTELCNVTATTALQAATEVRIPAFLEYNWGVGVNVSQTNISGVIAPAVQCLWTIGNKL